MVKNANGTSTGVKPLKKWPQRKAHTTQFKESNSTCKMVEHANAYLGK